MKNLNFSLIYFKSVMKTPTIMYRHVSTKGGGHLGHVPPPLEPNAQRKNLRRLKDLLDNTNELVSKFLSQQLHNKIIYIRYLSIFRFKVAQNLIAEQ